MSKRNIKFILVGLITLSLIMGAASALPLFGPPQGFRNNGVVELGTLTIGGVSITGGTVSYDDVKNEAYTNETAINTSIAALTAAAYTNETAINSSIDTLTAGAYTNETAINATIAAMPGSIIDTDYGLSNASGEIRVDIVADKGLEFSSGNLQVEAGDGIDLSSSGLAVDATDIIGVTHGLYEPSANNIGINLTANKGLEFGTGAAEGSLQIKLDGSSLSLGASGIKVTANTYAGNTAAYLNETAINSSIDALTANAYVNETAINASIDALVVPLATFAYDANSVDQGVFTASGGWVLSAVKMTPRVPGADGSAVTVMVKLCDSGEAPASGDNMLSGTLDLKGTADTPQSGTVSAGTIAAGKIVALDFTGTLTDAVGTITLYGTRA